MTNSDSILQNLVFPRVPSKLLERSDRSDEQAHLFVKHTKRAKKLLARIDTIRSSGNRSRIRIAFDSFSVRYTYAALYVLSSKKRLNKFDHFRRHQCAFEALERLARETGSLANLREPVKVISERKPNGSYRYIQKPGIKRAMMQLLTRDILRLSGFSSESDHSTYGVHSAINALHTNIARGYSHLFVGDIRDFFGSVETSYVRTFLDVLPHDVVSNIVLHPPSVLDVRDCIRDVPTRERIAAAQRGLPQGAITSPLISSALLGPVFEELTINTGEFVLYRDDFTVCAQTRGQVRRLKEALVERLANHNAGPFGLKVSSLVAPGSKFAFLGYSINQFEKDGSRALRVAPTVRSRMRLFEKLETILQGIPPEEFLASGLHYAQCWLVGKRSWTMCPIDADILTMELVAKIEEIASRRGILPDIGEYVLGETPWSNFPGLSHFQSNALTDRDVYGFEWRENSLLSNLPSLESA